MDKLTATRHGNESPLSKLISDSPVGPPLEGTVDQLLDQLKLKENRLRTQFELTKTPTLQKLISLNDLLTQRGGGSIILQNCDTTGLQGSVKELAAALRFVGSYKGKIEVTNPSETMTDKEYIEALITINKACADEFSFQPRRRRTRNLVGTSQKLCAALKKARNYSGKITVIDQPTVDQLKLIQHARTKTGKIILKTQEGALSGTGNNLVLALEDITGYEGPVTITDEPSKTQIKEIKSHCKSSVIFEKETQIAIGKKKTEIKNQLLYFLRRHQLMMTAFNLFNNKHQPIVKPFRDKATSDKQDGSRKTLEHCISPILRERTDDQLIETTRFFITDAKERLDKACPIVALSPNASQEPKEQSTDQRDEVKKQDKNSFLKKISDFNNTHKKLHQKLDELKSERKELEAKLKIVTKNQTDCIRMITACHEMTKTDSANPNDRQKLLHALTAATTHTTTIMEVEKGLQATENDQQKIIKQEKFMLDKAHLEKNESNIQTFNSIAKKVNATRENLYTCIKKLADLTNELNTKSKSRAKYKGNTNSGPLFSPVTVPYGNSWQILAPMDSADLKKKQKNTVPPAATPGT